MFNAPVNSNDFELMPTDTHTATCYSIIDLGTTYNDYAKKDTHKIWVTWEAPDCKMEDGRPFSISKEYTFSMSETANLRIDLQSWRGQSFTDEQAGQFDISKLIRKSCLLNVVSYTKKNGNEGVKIASIMKLPKSIEAPKPINEPVLFVLSEFNAEVFSSLGKFLQKRIRESNEYKEMEAKSNKGNENKDNANYPQDDIGGGDPEHNDEFF